MQTIITKSSDETRIIGKEIAQKITSRKVYLLYGDLGSGKTTFVQGFAEGLGITRRISSPTFIIMRSYEIRNKNQELRIKNLYHLDLYRTNSERDLEGLGLKEILNNSTNIVMIEWPERMGLLIPENGVKIEFEYLNDEERKIIIHDN